MEDIQKAADDAMDAYHAASMALFYAAEAVRVAQRDQRRLAAITRDALDAVRITGCRVNAAARAARVAA